MSRPAIAVGLALALFMPACTDSGKRPEQINSVMVRRAEFGRAWPLTVRSGLLACQPSIGGDDLLVTFRVGDTTYAVNGAAEVSGAFHDPDPIWKDEKEEGLKMGLHPLIDRGEELCGAAQ